MIDYSDKGREEFYKDTFEKIDKVNGLHLISCERKYPVILGHIMNMKLYEEGRKRYKKRLELLWKSKREYLRLTNAEEQIYGYVSSETADLKKEIEKSLKDLKSQSSTFERDLEEIMIDK